MTIITKEKRAEFSDRNNSISNCAYVISDNNIYSFQGMVPMATAAVLAPTAVSAVLVDTAVVSAVSVDTEGTIDIQII